MTVRSIMISTLYDVHETYPGFVGGNNVPGMSIGSIHRIKVYKQVKIGDDFYIIGGFITGNSKISVWKIGKP